MEIWKLSLKNGKSAKLIPRTWGECTAEMWQAEHAAAA